MVLLSKSELEEKFKNGNFKRFNNKDKEIILLKDFVEKSKDFPLEDSIGLNKEMENKYVLNTVGTLTDLDKTTREVFILGADSNLKFFLSKFESEKLNKNLNDGRVLGQLKIRKHETNIYFIEKVTTLSDKKKENHKKILELRKNYSTDEWKNLILNTLGYDLNRSEGITKDLMLIRVLPYLEKNYSYIELGGKSTGKSTLSDLFSSGEKIATDITASTLIYNNVKKEEGLLFKKDVLYLDESHFGEMKKEIATVLLQAKAGNKIQVRGNYDSKYTEASIISQGNVIKGEEAFKERILFKDFDKGFNSEAFFDRESFFLPGWIVPSYENIKVNKDSEVIPMKIFEDFLSIQREKDDYSTKIEDLKINLVGNETSGRFSDGIKKTISGLLKLLYPDGIIDFKNESENIKKIILLSAFGKYTIQEAAFDLEKEEFKNDYLLISWINSGNFKIDRNFLLENFIMAKENQYFINNEIKTSFSEFNTDSPWKKNKVIEENNDVLENLEYAKQRISIPSFFRNFLEDLPEEEKKIYTDSYKSALAYKDSNKTNSSRKEYLIAISKIFGLIWVMSLYYLRESEKKELNGILDQILNEKNFDKVKITNIFEGIQEDTDNSNIKEIINLTKGKLKIENSYIKVKERTQNLRYIALKINDLVNLKITIDKYWSPKPKETSSLSELLRKAGKK